MPYLRSWVESNQMLERSCRCIFFLLRAHHNLIVTNKGVLPGLTEISTLTRQRLQAAKDEIGFNLAGLRYLEQQLAEDGVRTFDDVVEKPAKEKKRKRKRVV